MESLVDAIDIVQKWPQLPQLLVEIREIYPQFGTLFAYAKREDKIPDTSNTIATVAQEIQVIDADSNTRNKSHAQLQDRLRRAAKQLIALGYDLGNNMPATPFGYPSARGKLD